MNRRTSQRLTLVMLVLASLTVLTLDYHGEAKRAINHLRTASIDVLSPVQRGISAFVHPVGDVFAGALHYGSLETQNEKLRDEIGATRRELAQSINERSAADQVLGLASLPFVSGIPSIPAEVIADASSNFEYTMEIDRGTSDGVGPGMPVIADSGSSGGLIGVVNSASSHDAIVLLITDARARVDVELSSGSTWVASGEGHGEPLSLSEPSGSSSEVHTGNSVYTSGLGGGTYPAGIPIGAVSAVRSSAGGFSQDVLVRPFVNLDDLQYVSVLEWLQPA
jgi:rod shape-determining protein MreC